VIDSPDGLDNEVEAGSFAHQLAAIIRTMGEQVLEPRPAFADDV
jgi:hypothetical protein